MNMVDSGGLLFHDSMLATAASCCWAIVLVADYCICCKYL